MTLVEILRSFFIIYLFTVKKYDKIKTVKGYMRL